MLLEERLQILFRRRDAEDQRGLLAQHIALEAAEEPAGER